MLDRTDSPRAVNLASGEAGLPTLCRVTTVYLTDHMRPGTEVLKAFTRFQNCASSGLICPGTPYGSRTRLCWLKAS